MARKRPTAFEVSYPDETPPGSTSLADRELKSRNNTSASSVARGLSSSTQSSRTASTTSRGGSTATLGSSRRTTATLSTPGPSSSSSTYRSDSTATMRTARPSASSHRSHSTASGVSSRSPSVSVPTTRRTQDTNLSRSHTQKRKIDDNSGHDTATSRDKRMRAPQPVPRYDPHPDDLKEGENTTILGEDPNEAPDPSDDYKPIRLLQDFVIFDPGRQREYISLSSLHEGLELGPNRRCEAAGFVAPVFVNDEDAAQDDDVDEDERSQRIHTTAVLDWSLDYKVLSDPLYIETSHAWYILKTPAQEYKSIFDRFYRPHRVAQVVISVAFEDRSCGYDTFLRNYARKYDDFLGMVLDEGLVQSCKSTILEAIDTIEGGERLKQVPMIRRIIGVTPAMPGRRHRQVMRPPPTSRRRFGGCIDLEVISPENQNRTHVTPLLDQLASGLFREHLEVIGAAPILPDKTAVQNRQRELRTRLVKLINKAAIKVSKIFFGWAHRLHDEYWKKVAVDDMVGDTIILQAGEYRNREVPERIQNGEEVPEDHTIADHFWFAKIIHINQKTKMFHVQWFEHATKTILQEISDPQQLFLTELCDDIEISLAVDKADVHWGTPPEGGLKPLRFFCNMMYSDKDASFTKIEEFRHITESMPPNNCSCCLKSDQQTQESALSELNNGFAFRGFTYHIDDYVMFKASEGPCHIGQISQLTFATVARGSNIVSVVMLGRISDIIDQCPEGIIKDERHLFFTDEERKVPIDLLIRKCFVTHETESNQGSFKSYLTYSPYHFFVKYHFPSLEDTSWEQHTRLRRDNVLICKSCLIEEEERMKRMDDFLNPRRIKKLRALDPFGGIGAFGLAMEETSPLEVTHAIEIAPSAARTYKQNSPNTIVYNQCANIVLKYAVKTHAGLNPVVPTSIRPGSSEPLPPPPSPGSIDCIIAGFPCQPHSTLNMFKKVDEKKSHLILNLLSWVDFLRPRYCFFENVRGFLLYNLNAVQDTKYRVRGGVEKGGIKFVIRALLAMNYQVRIGLLQAAHYGTPQTRVRFFLIAAQNQYKLPSFPTPIYDFPQKDSMEFKFQTLGESIAPIRTAPGMAPFRHITIEDAIGDLRRFDWKNPKRPNAPERMIENPAGIGPPISVPAFDCDSAESPLCGSNKPEYRDKPRTRFQVKCRALQRAVNDLQHYTRALDRKAVERVVNIPLVPKADYRSLRPDLWQWFFSNPSSSVARHGFRPGLFGRLDKNSWFRTTVTRVDPTAKQSWILHPYCHRIYSVRELARSQGFPDHFRFHSENGDIQIIHRQIGNAVAWQVANALGRELRDTLFEEWLRSMEEAIIVD